MTLVAGLRAAAYGVPFQPVGGVHGSDLAALNGWRKIKDPYGSGQEVYVIPAIRPDVAVIHANEVDEHGNARVLGSPFWDHPLTRAAKRVLVTAERLVPSESLARATGAHAGAGLHGGSRGDRAARRVAGLDASALRGRLPGGRGLFTGRRRRAGGASCGGAGTIRKVTRCSLLVAGF